MNKVVVLLLVFICGFNLQAQQNLKLGEPAPNINISSWIANAPENKELTNRFVVLEFWTTWCGPCIGAVPHVNELVKEFGDDILFVSLTNEPAARVERTLKRTPFLSAVATDESGHTNQEYGDGKSEYTFLPMTVLIDKGNVIKWIGNPSSLDSNLLKQFLDGSLVETNFFGDFAKIPEDYGLDSFTLEMLSIKKLDVPYYFDLKVTKPSSSSVTLTTNDMYANSKASLKTLISSNLKVAHNLIEVPKDYENKELSIIYKNKENKDAFNANLVNDVVNRLGLDLLIEKVSLDGFLLELENTSKLDSTLEPNGGGRSDIYDPLRPKVQGVIYRNITVENMLLDVSKTIGEHMVLEKTIEGDFDFTIETGTIADVKRSLESYGFSFNKAKIEADKLIYKQL